MATAWTGGGTSLGDAPHAPPRLRKVEASVHSLGAVHVDEWPGFLFTPENNSGRSLLP